MPQTSSDSTPSASPSAGPPAQTPAEPGRLPYTPPALVRFGAVSDLTSTAGRRGRKDRRRSRRRTGY